MQKNIIFLTALKPYSDHCLLLLRMCVGSFLIWGVWDNITNAGQMREFEAFLRNFGFFQPSLMAVLSVWAQFLVGCSFVLGLLIRWAGVICAINFIVAIVMVDSAGGIRASFPSMCLVLIGLYLATNGAGRFSLDQTVLRQYS